MNLVGRTPWSAADALVGFYELAQEAGQGAGRGPGGPPHQTAAAKFAAIFEGRCAAYRQPHRDPMFLPQAAGLC